MNTQGNKNEYARLVSLFLAELLHTRKISLDRAAEIGQKVLANINLIDTEQDFMKLVMELTRDFEELMPFEERVHIHAHVSERKDLERKVRAFVVSILATDMPLAIKILEEAIRDEVSLADLQHKFPEFSKYLETNSHQWNKIL